MTFTLIDYNHDILNNILLKIFNSQVSVNSFISLINHDFISISGSSILQILQQTYYNNSDLDIYIEIDNMNAYKYDTILELMLFLNNNFSKNLLFNAYLDIITKYYHSYHNKNYYGEHSQNYNHFNNHYSSLKKYIKFYQLYKQNNNKIELIFIKSNIEKLLLNTYDYDIVKNYWKQHNIYSFNIFSIYNKTATMTLNHFITRILLGAKIEFENFIKRYIKYSNRGYTIFIHKTNITDYIFNHLIKMHLNIKYSTYIPNFTHRYNMNRLNYNNIFPHLKIFINNSEILIRNIPKYDIAYYNKTLNCLVYNFPLYCIKFILITGIMQKYFIRKKLNKYSDLISNLYLHPTSSALYYKVHNWDTDKSNITYINTNNQLIILHPIVKK